MTLLKLVHGHENLDDDHIKAVARTNRRQAADLVIRKYRDAIFHHAVHIVKDYQEAIDVTQEVFIRLLQHPRLEELTLSVSYLIKVSHNLLRRRHSRSVRLRELLTTAVSDNLIERHGRPDRVNRDRKTERLESNQLQDAMSTLTADEQDAIRMIVWEGKSYEHAAESLEVSVTTINNWKHRGLAKLRKFADRSDADREASNTRLAMG